MASISRTKWPLPSPPMAGLHDITPIVSKRSVTNAAYNWQLIYRIAQRLTLRAQAGVEAVTTSTTSTGNQAPSWSLDAIYTWRWN